MKIPSRNEEMKKREVNAMSMLFTKKEAFEKVKKFLEENQYSFTFSISNGQFLISIQD